MNSSQDNEDTKKPDEELNHELLNLNHLGNKDDFYQFDEENVVTELNEVAYLSASKLSIRNTSQNQTTSKKNKFEKYFEKLPLKGFILATLCAVFNSIAAIFTKLVTEFSGI
jgi:hypothetical protein